MGSNQRSDQQLGRRRVLGLGATAAAVLAMPAPVRAVVNRAPVRRLRFDHLHTGEKLDVVYFEHGSYLGDALDAIDHVLRDFRTDEVKRIDPDLLDLIHNLHNLLGSGEPYQVVSGYRSPKTNAALAQRNSRVATHSLHMDGKAIDLTLPDMPLAELRRAALALQAGGVGYYPRSNFVHLDTGRVRSW